MFSAGKSATASSPFIIAERSVAKIMLIVALTLLPGICAYVYFYGWGVLANIVIATMSAWLFEFSMLVILKRQVKHYLFDGSVVVTAFLMAIALPPLVPWWLPVVGTFFAVVVVKHLYGGLGYNVFNPAMAAYAILLISFPAHMSLWVSPSLSAVHQLDFVQSLNYVFFQQLPAAMQIDAITSATPLDYLRTQLTLGNPLAATSTSPVFGVFGGKGMEWVNILFFAGGLWLIYKKIISWHIPVAVFVSILSVSTIAYLISPDSYYSPVIHMLGGATILGAFFIATDPVTAAATPLGKLIYGAGIGILTFAIRAWGAYPDGMAFAVILMGMTVPLLDQYTIPRVFGQRRRTRE